MAGHFVAEPPPFADVGVWAIGRMSVSLVASRPCGSVGGRRSISGMSRTQEYEADLPRRPRQVKKTRWSASYRSGRSRQWATATTSRAEGNEIGRGAPG